MMDDKGTTTGNSAGNLLTEFYKALHEITVELLAPEMEQDREFIEAHMNRFIAAIMELGDGKEHRAWLRLGVEPDKVFEAELILRLKDDDRVAGSE